MKIFLLLVLAAVAVAAIRVEDARKEPSMAQMKKDHALASELLEIIPEEAKELRKSHQKVMGSLLEAHERLKQLEQAGAGEEPGLAAQEAHLQAMRARILSEISESARGLNRLGARLTPSQLARMADPYPDHRAARRALGHVSPSLLSYYEKLHAQSAKTHHTSTASHNSAAAARQVLQLIHGLEHEVPAPVQLEVSAKMTQDIDEQPSPVPASHEERNNMVDLVKHLRSVLLSQVEQQQPEMTSSATPVNQSIDSNSTAGVHEFQGIPERIRFLLGAQGALECSCMYKESRSQLSSEDPIMGAADTSRPWIPAPGQSGAPVSPAHCYDSCQEFKCTPIFRSSGWDSWHDCVQGCVGKCYGKDVKL